MKTEFHMITSRTADPAECRRRLGQVYRLLISLAEESGSHADPERPDDNEAVHVRHVQDDQGLTEESSSVPSDFAQPADHKEPIDD